MKTSTALKRYLIIVPALLILAALNAEISIAQAQGTAFTYQGRLNNGTNPVTGGYDLTFSLYTANAGGTLIGGPVTNLAVGVTNGLFTTSINFGAVFSNTPAWLAIGVRTNGTGTYNSLTPLQQLTPTPYAITAENLSGPVPSADLSGTYGGAVTLSNGANNFGGNGSGLTGLNASALATGTVPDARLAADVALTDVIQNFTGTNTFQTGTNNGRFMLQGNAGIDTSLFTGLGFQYYGSSGEGAIMSSYNDGYASLSFYTKQGGGYPVAKQVVIDRYGGVAIDQQANNAGVINNGTTNGVGLTFGSNSGEGIASQRTSGINADGLDFYTGYNHRMSILHNGDVGINNTNPLFQLAVAGTVSATNFSGSGAGLTNLNAGQLAGGTLPLSALPAAVVTNDAPAVDFINLTLTGSLTLPASDSAIYTGGSSLVYSDSKYNFYAGFAAGVIPSIGGANTAIGSLAMAHSTNEEGNVAIGYEALYSDNAGTVVHFTGIGGIGGSTVVYPAENTAIGYQAMVASTSGSTNTAVGYMALAGNTSGEANTAVGASALNQNQGGWWNTAIGFNALAGNAGGFANTAIGFQALPVDAGNVLNVALGYDSLLALSSGNYNTALGGSTLSSLMSGGENLALGFSAGSAYTSSESYNIDIGSSGTAGESYITHLGNGQTDAYVAGTIHGNAGLNIDQASTYGQNNGTVHTNALTFGTGPGGSGEGIASQRTSGPNQFDLVLYTGFDARLTVLSDGNVGIGITNPAALLEVGGSAVVDNNLSAATLTIRGGSDLAEPFKISNPEADAPEGAVVVIDAANPGHLKLSDRPYDQHVAGVISGANGIHPGIQMQQQGLLDGGRNVALTGRVYVQADTSNGPIFPGDMLTTSRLPGRAMRVTDHGRAEGAILGKAMTGLMKGKGMVLVLVTLQ